MGSKVREVVDDYVIHPMPKEQAIEILGVDANARKKDLIERRD